jgi:uncharacterized protein (TIGR00661 family)
LRIAYGVFGYGRGHATRALAVLPDLTARHDVLLLAGGDAHAALSPYYPVQRIPTLRFVYQRNGRRDQLGTVLENLPAVWELLTAGRGYRAAVQALRDFKPDVAICDADPWTHRACAQLGIPRISFDHFGIMAHCRPSLSPADARAARRDVWIYRTLMGRPARIMVSSFYEAPPRSRRVRCIGPLLRDQVRAARARSGEHLLVYLNNGRCQLTTRLEESLHATKLPTVIYGTDREGVDGNLVFERPDDERFIDRLASCRAVISTAGNQLVGEAMFLGKPLLVRPEDSVEQRMNAAAVARLGIGEEVAEESLDAPRIARFLERGATYRENARTSWRDGRAQALDCLESFAGQLRSRRLRMVRRAPRFV